MLRIAFAEYPAFSQTVVLDGTAYRLRFQWNTRGQYWAMDLATQDKTPIVTGIKLVLDYELIGAYHAIGTPPGELWALDSTEKLLRIGRDDIKDGPVKLVYIPEAEVAAAL